MMNTRLNFPALWCAFALLTMTACGCTSMKGAGESWSAAWKKSSQPKPTDPNHEEVVTYWGQKKKQPKPTEMPAELKERLAKKNEESQRSRSFADNFKEGNQKLRENRLDEAKRAYELALAVKPDDPDVHHRLAVVADKQRMFGLADDHYEAALRKRPRDPNLLSDIGYSHSLRGNDQQAEKTLLEALALDPAHKGAMANLGAIYAKQGRYDETYAIFRRGVTETEAQQYVAQLFPQGRPAGSGDSNQALASNQKTTESRTAPQMPPDDKTDLGKMTMDQLKAEMERRRIDSIQKRQQQVANVPPSLDWANDQSSQSPASTSSSQNSQPWTLGPGSNNQSNAQAQSGNPGGIQISPNMSINSQPPAGSIQLPPNLQASPGGGGSSGMIAQTEGNPQQPFGSPPPTNNSLMAPRGTNPQSNMEFWSGASGPQNGQPNATSQQTLPNAMGSWNQQPPFAAQQSASNAPGMKLDPNWQYPGTQPGNSRQNIEQVGYTTAASSSQAAAQLAMNAGPGSLFPIVPADSGSAGNGNMHPSGTQSFEQRLGGEFSQPPQYQNPATPFTPNTLPKWPGSGTSSNAAPQSSSGGDAALAPASPANNWIRPFDSTTNWQQPGTNSGSGVVQAGGFPAWSQSSGRSIDSSDVIQADGNSGSTSRYAKSPWGDATSPQSGSRPYSGSWPNSNSLPAVAPSGGSTPSAASNGSPAQWPYSPQQR